MGVETHCTEMNSKTTAGQIIQIDSIAFGGRGVGKREDGKVVFAAGTLPGETIRAAISREYKHYALADTKEVLVPSPDRIKPPCSLFPRCGGCDWQHIAYPKQVELKQDILLGQLMHKCRMDEAVIEEPVPSPAGLGYRCHAILRCSEDNGFSMGFYQKATSTIVPLEHCPVLNEKMQSILASMREILRRKPVPGIHSLDVHALEGALVRIIMGRRPVKKELSVFQEIFQETNLTGLSCIHAGDSGAERIWGSDSLRCRYRTRDRQVCLSTGFGGFIQINAPVNESMVGYVIELATGSESVLDLFCGNGNFSVPLAFNAGRVLGVEKDPDLIRLAGESSGLNRTSNMTFMAMDAGKAVRSLVKKHAGFDTIVLDPPREGAKDVVGNLACLNPRRIIYISCDPSTLSRDLSILEQDGYRLKTIRLFDMFPQTYHLESVSCLER